MTKENFIEVKDVKKSFGENEVLKGLSFGIQKGEVLGLLGHNGAGKTTTLRIILGLVDIDNGTVSVNELNPYVSQKTILEQCGVLSEDNGLYESMTIYDNLKFFAKAYGCYDDEFDDRVDELLKRFEILDSKHDVIKNFSLGMKKKTAIIRTIFHEPQIIMMDEPTNGLDPVSVQTLSDIIKEYSEEKGITFILTTHNLDIVSKICSKVVIVKNGINVYTTSLKDNVNDLVRTKIYYEATNNIDINSLICNLNEKIEIDSENHEIILYSDDKNKIIDLVNILVKNGVGIFEVKRKAFDLTNIYMETEMEDHYE